MSSLVQAKWVSSAMRVESERGEAAAHEVLDGLDVVAGGRLERGELVDVGLAEVGDDRAQGGLLLGRRAATEPKNPRSVCAISHSTSTCTRARLRPASERCSPSSPTAARYRPSSGLSGWGGSEVIGFLV